MTHGSLFSGVGGFDLAASWLGWDNLFHVEIDPFCQRVLAYHFPHAVQHKDITQTNFKVYEGAADVISGGFPCQPFSHAGKRKGRADDRYLWAEMLRAVQEVQPTWVVAENVYGLTTIEDGLVFEGVLADLESAGYEVQPFVIPACGVNAKHRRDRLWVVAHRNPNQRRTGSTLHQQSGRTAAAQTGHAAQNSDSDGCLQRKAQEAVAILRQQRNAGTGGADRVYLPSGVTANTESQQGKQPQPKQPYAGKAKQEQPRGGHSRLCSKPNWDEFPAEPPVCSRADGISSRLDGATFPKLRAESIKAYGNAIVPQVAYELFTIIDTLSKL